MPRRRDPNFKTGHLCRFCGALISWGEILRLIRVDPDQPPYTSDDSKIAAHQMERAAMPPGMAADVRGTSAPALGRPLDPFLPAAFMRQGSEVQSGSAGPSSRRHAMRGQPGAHA